MSDRRQLERLSSQIPSRLPMPEGLLPISREARAIVRNDRATEVKARQQYNRARLRMNQNLVDTEYEAMETVNNARLVAIAMHKAVEVDEMAHCMSVGRSPAIEMTLREMQAAFEKGQSPR